MAGQGNLKMTWKVREKSGNLKINGYGRQTSFILLKRGEDVLSHGIVEAHLPPHWGLLIKEVFSPSPSSLGATFKVKNLLHLGANSFL